MKLIKPPKESDNIHQSFYKDLLDKHLAPLLPGCHIDYSGLWINNEHNFHIEDKHTFYIAPQPTRFAAFQATRSWPFNKSDFRLAEAFSISMSEIVEAISKPYFSHLSKQIQESVFLKVIRPSIVDEGLVGEIIDTLHLWSKSTYENSRIATTFGIDTHPKSGNISNIYFNEVIKEPFMKVIGSGEDTMIVLSPSGHLIKHYDCSEPDTAPTTLSATTFAPRSHCTYARWSMGRGVAFSLTTHGEILAFHKGALAFAFRRGNWAHYNHESLIACLCREVPETLALALHATCIDVAFSRTGGCIAVCKPTNTSRISKFVNSSDLLAYQSSPKSRTFKHLIGTSFQRLPRSIREEIAAVDGAVVLNHLGNISAIGAIVSIKSGSPGGGRDAAARALSALGISFKISSDGGIYSFKCNKSGDAELLYSV